MGGMVLPLTLLLTAVWQVYIQWTFLGWDLGASDPTLTYRLPGGGQQPGDWFNWLSLYFHRRDRYFYSRPADPLAPKDFEIGASRTDRPFARDGTTGFAVNPHGLVSEQCADSLKT